MIEIKDLSLSYGGRKVLDNMNLKLDDGKIVGLVGENGTGFRVIIVIEANIYVNIRSSRLLPKYKTQKINSWCAA